MRTKQTQRERRQKEVRQEDKENETGREVNGEASDIREKSMENKAGKKCPYP